MRHFELVDPGTLKEACALLSDNEEAKVIAGGTALLTLIKHGIFVPKTLVNLKKIKGASDISYDAQTGLRVGALAAIYDIEASPLVRQHCPVLAEACHVVANIRILTWPLSAAIWRMAIINPIRPRCWWRWTPSSNY